MAARRITSARPDGHARTRESTRHDCRAGGGAQSVADTLVEAGVRSLLNFADVRLRLPPDVYVEHIDIGVTLEKVAFFARRPAAGQGRRVSVNPPIYL